MELNKWVGACKVRAFPWIDKQHIYVNVQCFQSGKSLYQPPVFDRTVYIKNDEKGRDLVFEFTDTLVEAIRFGKIKPGSYIQVMTCPGLGALNAGRK